MDHQRLSREQFFVSSELGPSGFEPPRRGPSDLGLPRRDGPGGTRDAIAKSWHRSRLSGVQPSCLDPPYAVLDDEHQHRLLRAVRPVLEHLDEQLSGCDVSLAVADADAKIASRWVTSGHLARQLDRIMLAAGFSYNEQHVGTNAIGTALEQGAATTVVGGEHFVDALQDMACAAAPIHDPRTGRVIGVIDATALCGDFSLLMLPLVRRAVADIEQRLADEASTDERLLLARFLQVTRRSRRPVVSMNDRICITNRAAAALLDVTDHAVLWEAVRRARAMPTAPDAVLQIGNAQAITARLAPVVDGGRVVGEIVELRPESAPRDGRSRSAGASRRARSGDRRAARWAPSQLPLLVGRSTAWTETVARAVHYAQGPGRVLVQGEPGVGKLAVARAMHELRAKDAPFVVCDAAEVASQGPIAWAERTARALGGPPATVVIRHLDLLAGTAAQQLAQDIDDVADHSGVWLAATIATDLPGPRLPVVDRFPSTVVVPPLRQRADDVPVLIENRLGGRACSPDAVSALVAQHWPGNVRELYELLDVLCREHAAGSPLGLEDLPPRLRMRRSNRLTLLEQAEVSAILDALASCSGNKVHAAKRLGLSRSSLYRKIAALGVDWV